MMHAAETPKRTLEDALYILSIEKEVPDAAVLDKVVRAFPEYAEELTDFAIDIALDCLRNRSQETETSVQPVQLGAVSPAVSRAMSRFQNRLHAVQTLPVSNQTKQTLATSRIASEAKNPFQRLSREEFRSLAERMGVNSMFVTKLRDRQIVASTIPTRFRSKLAEEMEVPLELVIAHLEASPVVPQRQFYKCVEKPHHVAQQTFVEAVRGCGMSKDQQDALLEI
jgi:hypothetical protein